MGDYIDRDRFLVDGKCSVCGTTVLSECAGGFLRFVPHDDPEWCRGAAALQVKTLERALQQANEDRAMALEREKFYRSAYATAIDELERNIGLIDQPFRSHNEWRGHVEHIVRVKMEEEKQRSAVQLAEAMKIGVCHVVERAAGDETARDPRGVEQHIKANKRGPL